MNIVIIDDCSITCFVHKKLFNEVDKDVCVNTYLSAQNFLNDLKANKIEQPDVILTDYNLGSSNGAELINEIDNYKFNCNIEDKLDTYLVSSDTNIASIAEQCNKSIFKGFFMKPLQLQNVENLLHKEFSVSA